VCESSGGLFLYEGRIAVLEGFSSVYIADRLIASVFAVFGDDLANPAGMTGSSY
jgi:hypothetical protein